MSDDESEGEYDQRLRRKRDAFNRLQRQRLDDQDREEMELKEKKKSKWKFEMCFLDCKVLYI